MTETDFGVCPRCGAGWLEPVYFIEEELKLTSDGHLYSTGRKRRAVSHLVCTYCLKNQCVDDSFDGPWRTEG